MAHSLIGFDKKGDATKEEVKKTFRELRRDEINEEDYENLAEMRGIIFKDNVFNSYSECEDYLSNLNNDFVLTAAKYFDENKKLFWMVRGWVRS